jgi:hypothetical protein
MFTNFTVYTRSQLPYFVFLLLVCGLGKFKKLKFKHASLAYSR